jgi:catechol-2,3-dioxygenase
MYARIFFALAALAVAPLPAQLAAPNADGVSMGHIHLAVRDVDAHKQFWTATMGGTLVKSGPRWVARSLRAGRLK